MPFYVQADQMESDVERFYPFQMVSTSCDFVDMERFKCRYLEAGLRPGRFPDSTCSLCLAGLEQFRCEDWPVFKKI